MKDDNKDRFEYDKILTSYKDIKGKIDSYNLIGRAIKDIRVVGYSYWHSREFVELTEYHNLLDKGISKEEAEEESKYENIKDDSLHPRYMEIDEPILFRFEDGDELGIEAIMDDKYRIFMNAISWDATSSVNERNADATIIFSPCIGSKIIGVEYETYLCGELEEELSVSEIIIHLSNSMSFSIGVVDLDYCGVYLLDKDWKVVEMEFKELKTALTN